MSDEAIDEAIMYAIYLEDRLSSLGIPDCYGEFKRFGKKADFMLNELFKFKSSADPLTSQPEIDPEQSHT